MSGFMLSMILHRSLLWATIEFRLTFSTLRGLTDLAVSLGFVCWERCVLGTEVGDEVCTGSPGLLGSAVAQW